MMKVTQKLRFFKLREFLNWETFEYERMYKFKSFLNSENFWIERIFEIRERNIERVLHKTRETRAK